MTIKEAKEVLGYREGDVILKTGLAGFKKAYKKWLKNPDTSKEIKKTVERDLEAVETLMNGE